MIKNVLTLLLLTSALSGFSNAFFCDRFPLSYPCQKNQDPADRYIYEPTYGNYAQVGYESGGEAKSLYMRYTDIGTGNYTFVFLHGQPTNKFLWRHVMPYIAGCDDDDYVYNNACNGLELEGVARVIAVDYPGFGQSGKPKYIENYDYRMLSHAKIVEQFILDLDLYNVILVTQDWGGGVGLNFVGKHPERVAGFVCTECVYFELPTPQFDPFFNIFNEFRTDEGTELILDEEFAYFLNQQLRKTVPKADRTPPLNTFDFTIRNYTEFENKVWAAPFLTRRNRMAMIPPPRDIPAAGFPSDTAFALAQGRDVLHTTSVEKLFVTTDPGLAWNNDGADFLQFLVQDAASLTLNRNISIGTHYTPSEPEFVQVFGPMLRQWFLNKF